MIIKLNARDRLNIFKFLPKTANLEEAIVSSDLKDKINFSQEELEKFDVKTIIERTEKGDMPVTRWNNEGNIEVDFELTRLEIKILKEGLERLNKDAEVNVNKNFLNLCKKIKALK